MTQVDEEKNDDDSLSNKLDNLRNNPQNKSLSPKEAETYLQSQFDKGQYLEAYEWLKGSSISSASNLYQKWKETLGERFCKEKRPLAAQAFRKAKNVGDIDVRRKHLQEAEKLLSICVTHFVGLPEADKADRNLKIVKRELEKISP